MILAYDELDRHKLPQLAQRRWQRRRGVAFYNRDVLARLRRIFLFESAVTH